LLDALASREVMFMWPLMPIVRLRTDDLIALETPS
jgi:hypothetical protein